MGFDLQVRGRRAGTAVELVRKLAIKMDPERFSGCHLDERRAFRFSSHRPAHGPHPVERIGGRDDSEFQKPVVGPRRRENVDAAKDPADVSREHA